MDRVELVPVPCKKLKGIGLDKSKWVARLRVDVHADDIEASAVISHTRAPLATEQV